MKKLLVIICLIFWGTPGYAFDMNQIQVHGFISQGYLHSDQYDYLFADTSEGTMEFNEFGLNFSSQLSDRLRLGVQFLSRDVGTFGNNDVTVDWAFGDYRYRNWLGFRAGKIKRPVGLYNKFRDIDAARTNVFLPPSIYDESIRDYQTATIGAGIYGILPAGFEYEIQYGTVDIQAESAGIAFLDGLFGTRTQQVDVADDTYILALTWNTPLEGLRLVGNFVSNYSWQNSTPTGMLDFDSELITVSAEYVYNALTCAVEYRQREFDIHQEGVRFANPTGEYYYGLLSYRFTDWLELGTYYSVSYSDKDDKDGTSFEAIGQPAAVAWLKDLAVTARFDLNDHWIVKLEGHRMDGLSGVTDFDQDPSDEWFLFAAKVTFSF